MTIFHPAVQNWFDATFGRPTDAQAQAWPAVKRGRHTLIAAPTGSGKTLAAFLSAIDDLVREGGTFGLADQCYVLYVSPLKALSNDVQKNLQLPLMGINDELNALGLPAVHIRAMVRTGDTPAGEREKMRRRPPHILVTTPESLFILLTSDSGRKLLTPVRSVIVDEIHAVAASKRGAHLALSLERLEALCERPLTRIGLSATQKPIDTVARFLTGDRDIDCTIVDSGHVRRRDLAIEVPLSPLEAVMSAEVWQEVYRRLTELIADHRTTLIFVNTRRMAERVAHALAEHLGEEAVTSHHGSLAREHRLRAEQRLKNGELKALVATASLELGIDIGEIDLVCQLGSPRNIAAFLQRVGRSGHSVGGVPKGRLFPLTRDDLFEAAALLDAVQRGELDALRPQQAPIDVLAQQIVAEVASREWSEAELLRTLRRAWPYRNLSGSDFERVLAMLADGYTTRRGRRSAYLHRDAVNRKLRPRKGARLTAVTNGGAIPDHFDYDVIVEPAGQFIGTLNEDFAFESLPGDIFQLGNTSYRILKVETGKVRVEDAQGQPPNIPFWFGEAPGRSDELSSAVSRLRGDLQRHLEQGGPEGALQWLVGEKRIGGQAAVQLVEYLAAARAALQLVPTQNDVVIERFFDEAGDQHLVIHSPYGSRLNRAWGLALRKTFCRKFNFELQAAALEDSIVLSLGATHSFPLEEVQHYLKSASARDLLTQALLDAPMFMTHWRWNATVALAIKRNRNGAKVPAQWQRMDAEDLVALVFPDQLACQENLTGKREVPDHPLVQQTLHDCLTQVMDVDGLEALLRRIEAGRVRVHCRELVGPSPLACEILGARPYAFLDDAPAEERRTQAVMARRFSDPPNAAELGRLAPEAIEQVRTQAWPAVGNSDEMHDALLLAGFITALEFASRTPEPFDICLQTLIRDRRVTLFFPSEFDNNCTGQQNVGAHNDVSNRAVATDENPGGLWVAAERLHLLQALYPDGRMQPSINAVSAELSVAQSLVELLRLRLQCLGPVSETRFVEDTGLPLAEIQAALLTLENEGFAMRGRFTAEALAGGYTEWCERSLLARIHRYTIKNLRREIKPVPAASFMAFLFEWQGIAVAQPRENTGESTLAVLLQLEGIGVAAAAWESEVLPARIRHYSAETLDALCQSGQVVWQRPQAGKVNGKGVKSEAGAGRSLVRNTPITLMPRDHRQFWQASGSVPEDALSRNARAVFDALRAQGASFFADLAPQTGLLRTQIEEALAELVAGGLITSDAFAGLRALIAPARKKTGFGASVQRRRSRPGTGYFGAGFSAQLGSGFDSSLGGAGRWSLLQAASPVVDRVDEPKGWLKTDYETLEHIAWVLLRRYGVIFRRLLDRETGLPPWRELLYVLRRFEARGDIRGGRFVDAFSGEQFALPEAAGLLRTLHNRAGQNQLVALCAADPLNLTGIITPGQRVPALVGNRILYRDGVPVAVQLKQKVQFLETVAVEDEWELRNTLIRTPGAGRYRHVPGLENPGLLREAKKRE